MEHLSSETMEQEETSSGINPLSFVVALIAVLIIGGAIGYGLGLLQANQEPAVVVVTATPDPQQEPAVIVVTATPDPQAVAQVEPSSAAAQNDTSNTETESDSNNSAPTPTIMDFLLSDARHFQGNADAPVTIIEFSDFK
jgi:protein-disulfide isomerase